MMNDDDVVVARASGRETVEELRRSGALDALFERLDAGEVEMTGSEGLLPALLKEALERGLAAELTEHLGYEKGQTSGQARSADTARHRGRRSRTPLLGRYAAGHSSGGLRHTHAVASHCPARAPVS